MCMFIHLYLFILGLYQTSYSTSFREHILKSFYVLRIVTCLYVTNCYTYLYIYIVYTHMHTHTQNIFYIGYPNISINFNLISKSTNLNL